MPQPQSKPQAAPDFIPDNGQPDFIPDTSAPPGETPKPDERNGLQRGYDEFEGAKPEDAGLSRWSPEGIKMRLVQGAGDLVAPFVHPEQAAQSAAKPSFASMALGPGYDAAKGLVHAFREDPVRALPGAMSMIAAPEAGGEAGDAATALRSATREAALGGEEGANASALQALRIPPGSTKATRTLNAVEGSRPFLKGTKSVAEAQERIPAAKSEIWAPYEQTVQAIGDRPLRGPDGMTTVRQLEEERVQLSALNRGLKNGDPAAVQLAQQKGLTQAQLLDRERAVQGALDPELTKAGIQPTDIRKAFGQVSQVGSRLMGRSTLAEAAQPYGFGRMANIKLDSPRSWLGEPVQGMRDVFAGRPLWSGKPSDVAMGEAFRSGGPKPNFGQVRPQTKLQLPASIPPREGEFSGEWDFGTPNEPQVTPAPRAFPALPARAGEGTAQPMIWAQGSRYPELAEDFARERIQPTRFNGPPENPFNLPKGLLEAPKKTATPRGGRLPIRDKSK